MPNMKTFDINLLVIFDVLMAERHVTRAAKRIGVTQPAMTSALNRLRVAFDDELLVRAPGGMVPTPWAQKHVGIVRDILRSVESLLDGERGFDPRTSVRTFRVRMSDLMAAILLPALLGALRRRAPECRLEIISLPPGEIVRALEDGRCDLSVGMGIEHGNSIRASDLLRDRFVCVYASGMDPGPTSLQAFRAARHLRIAQGPLDNAFSDAVLTEAGVDGRILVDISHWLVAGALIEASDLVLVTSERFAEALRARYAVASCEIPALTPPIAWRAYWHRRDEADDGAAWLRALVYEVASGSGTGGTSTSSTASTRNGLA